MRNFLCVLFLSLGLSASLSLYGQKSSKKYEATVYYVSGFKDKGLLEEVKLNGIVLNDGQGSRVIEAESIRKITVKPYRSGRKALLTGAFAGAAGVGLTYNIRRGYGQKMEKGGLPVLLVSAAAVTGGYFWFMNSVIQTAVFRDVNHPGKFRNYRSRLVRFSVAGEE